MSRIQYIILFVILSSAEAINRPVYKIVLTQKGFAQFLQYDVETPPMREFTFCTWLRFFDLSNDQSIFTYVAHDNSRVVRVWLDSGGRYIKISLNGGASSSTPIDISKNTWRHICLSYQSDFGAWALYLDGRLESCEAASSLYGFVIPGGGSVIIGYGLNDSGVPNGLEGEVFGATMILTSTIERNYTIKRDPQFRQKSFKKNKLLANNDIKYIVLSDMPADAVQETSETSKFPFFNTNRSFIKFTTPHSVIEHDVGLDLLPEKMKSMDGSSEKEILDFSRVKDKSSKTSTEKINFWALMNEAGNIGKFNGKIKKNMEQSGSGTQDLPSISEFETPPPPISFQDFVRTNVKFKKPVIIPYFDVKENEKSVFRKSISNQNRYVLSDMEKPPPPEKNVKVYGQWTSSQFANSVLNYIKNFNNQFKEQKKVPSTIPLIKLSDTFPYASDFKLTKVRPPYKIERRNFLEKHINKRHVKHPEINVEILHDDLRSQILESHAKTQPQNVKIISRGHIEKNKDHRINRDVDNKLSNNNDMTSKMFKSQSFADSKIKLSKTRTRFNFYKNSNLMAILPFLKSEEYFIDGMNHEKTSSSNDIYTKTLSNGNKWHNVKSYSNDYTPRRINMESEEIHDSIDTKIAEVNKKNPSIKLKYMPHNHKIVKNVDEEAILNGRALATEISNLSNINANSVSILKYNHGFLPTYEKNMKNINKIDSFLSNNSGTKNFKNKNSFNENVKIGNALNERYTIGNNEEQNKQSFIGGDEKIPDINRYRSNFENGIDKVPPSLGLKVCKNVELYDRLFYIQPDGSIDVTHILSPVKEKNIGIEFVAQNYKKCSLEDSSFEYSPMLFIDWSKTPVRLFGGPYPKKTTDLCGFF